MVENLSQPNSPLSTNETQNPPLLRISTPWNLRQSLFIAALLGCWFIISYCSVSWFTHERLAADLLRYSTELNQSKSAVTYHFERSMAFLKAMPTIVADDMAVGASLRSLSTHVVSKINSPESKRAYLNSRQDLAALNRHLHTQKNVLDVDAIWILAVNGDCISSSNYDQPESFVGVNYVDRSYFTSAMSGLRGRQYAVGRKTNIPGLFFSAPVFSGAQVIGAVAFKIDIAKLSLWFQRFNCFVTDAEGVIILASDKSLENMALVDAKVFSMTSSTRDKQYKRRDFPLLKIGDFGNGLHSFPAITLPGSDALSMLTRSQQIKDGGYTIFTYTKVPEIEHHRTLQVQCTILVFISGAALILLASGIRRYLCDMRDSITAADSANQAKNELLSKINSLNKRFSLAADSAGIGVWEYLVPENRLIWDAWMYALYGILEEDFAGAYEAWQNGLHPDDKKRGDNEISMALRGEKDFDTEFRVIWPTGEVRHIKANALVIRDDAGNPLRMIGVNYDITERKRAEDELHEQALLLECEVDERQRAQDGLAVKQLQLETINSSLQCRIDEAVSELRLRDQHMITQGRQAAMGEMIGNIAHQWRQPLNALAMQFINIRSAYQYNELNDEYLEKSVENGNRLIQKMSTTVTDFSNFFRPNKSREKFSMLEQIKQAVGLVEASLISHNINIKLEADGDVLLVGFANEYSQVLLNLLSNAGEAIKESGISGGKITIRLYEHKGLGCVSISDTGSGIPDAAMEKIFEPYFSTKKMGTGIGLYMSKMIIERSMNGHIEAHNIEGGAEFIVSTPLEGDVA